MRLELQDLSAGYGAIQALRSVDLAIEPGTVTAIVGPNGAGKSTLLNTIMGLVPARGGRIRLDGQDIAGLPAEARASRGLALSPEGRRLFPGLTVEENLMTGAYWRRDRGRGRDLARILDLFPALGRRRRQAARTLSGGEQQMVAVGRALMSKPRILLLDEPSLGLAPVIVDGLGDVISDINRDGVTVVLVEQDARWALSLSGLGHIMEGGRLIVSAAASQLLDDQHVRKAYLGEAGVEPRLVAAG